MKKQIVCFFVYNMLISLNVIGVEISNIERFNQLTRKGIDLDGNKRSELKKILYASNLQELMKMVETAKSFYNRSDSANKIFYQIEFFSKKIKSPDADASVIRKYFKNIMGRSLKPKYYGIWGASAYEKYVSREDVFFMNSFMSVKKNKRDEELVNELKRQVLLLDEQDEFWKKSKALLRIYKERVVEKE